MALAVADEVEKEREETISTVACKLTHQLIMAVMTTIILQLQLPWGSIPTLKHTTISKHTKQQD